MKINLFEGEDKKSSNIALVKFAGEDRTLIGNDTYEEEGYVYNYSQTVKALTSADAAGREALIDAVNNLSAGGATHADYGMQHAQSILSPANTDERKQIVVMFTDGSPTYDNGFKLETANSAIKTASEMKESGVTIKCKISRHSAGDKSQTHKLPPGVRAVSDDRIAADPGQSRRIRA